MPDSLLPWILIGGFGNTATLSYAMLSRHFPPEYAGRANAVLNAMVFAGVFLMQYLIGAVISIWPETARGYAPDGYPYAFGIVFVLQVASWLWFLVPDRSRHAQALGEAAE
jgi:MFS family permease